MTRHSSSPGTLAASTWATALSALALAWLSQAAHVEAQTFYESAHIVGVTATDANADIEVVFDKPVCAARTPATRAQVLKSKSTNHALLYSALVAAFLSNLSVRVQTADDDSCHILSLRVSR